MAVLPLAAACSSAGTPTSDDEAVTGPPAPGRSDALGVEHETAPLYTFDLGNASAVYLWEFAPGQVVFSESAAAGVGLPHLTHDLTGRVTRVFEALRPGETIPDVLASAQERQDRRVAELAASRELQQRGREVVVEAPVTPSKPAVALQEAAEAGLIQKDNWHDWFVDNLCIPEVLAKWPRAGVVEECETHRTNGGTWNFSNRAESLSSVMPYRGSVTFSLTVWWNGGSASSNKTANVAAGFAYAWEFYDDSFDDKHDYRFSITNATDDGYHRSTVSAWNSCRPGCQGSGDLCLCPARE